MAFVPRFHVAERVEGSFLLHHAPAFIPLIDELFYIFR